jgi:transposase
VREGLGIRGLLYVGNCKMASMETRASIQWAGDFYLTPLPATQVSPEQMEGYPQPYLFGAQKLADIYIESNDHATGLIRLLFIGLRVLVLLDFVVRSRLSEEKAKLEGLYAVSPKRKTAHPTAERLLEAFKDITLTGIHQKDHVDYHLTSLSTLQERILRLLGLDPSVYSRLIGHFPKPG